MGKIIAGIYELGEELGAGGGGIVYIGYHLRLNKKVVLKADKRNINTEEKKLRREVDMLKGLSHTFIPQVYDYVQEDGIVYTVMDFIEGESLDKLLKESKRASQQEIVKWSCQLLEALDYLHTYPPHGILHGDIKPANIMRTPEGDIRLIDFNIALALGAEGAVKVGLSRGYASPEHYGITYISNHRAAAIHTRRQKNIRSKTDNDEVNLEDEDKTLVLDKEETELLEDHKRSSFTWNKKKNHKEGYSIEHSVDGKETISLDARSDIYSLGATLYHLISGKRPSPDAIHVEELGNEVCSAALASIIKKAMDPDANERYQTAKEMLLAVQKLYQTDERSVLHRKRITMSIAIIASLFVLGGSSTFIGLKQMQQRQEALTLAEYSENALSEGDVSKAIELALEAIPQKRGLFNTPVTAEAQKTLTAALGMYDLTDGFKETDLLSLPAIPFFICSSTEGSYAAISYAYELIILDTKMWNEIVSLPMEESSLSEAVFLNDHQIIYASDQGVSLYDIESKTVLWRGETATSLALSKDRRRIAALNRDESKAMIYDTKDGSVIQVKEFSGRHQDVPENDIFISKKNNVFSLNHDGKLLAVSFSGGELILFDLEDENRDILLQGEEEIQAFSGEFYQEYFLYTTKSTTGSEFYIVDLEKEKEMKGLETQRDIILQVRDEGVYLATGNLLVEFFPDTLEEKEAAYVSEASIINYVVEQDYSLIATDKNTFAFFDRGGNLLWEKEGEFPFAHLMATENYAIVGNHNDTSMRVMERNNNSDKTIIKYSPYYDHDEARISSDGQSAMLFNYREFAIFDKEGREIISQELPEQEKIYDQQYQRTEKGEWLKVIWYDGTVRHYNAKDGKLLYEGVEKQSEKDLKEEFLLNNYRIVSSLHEQPEVYYVDNGKYKMTLEEDAYLTYVTEVDNYIVTEYISVEGERFGVLHNHNFEVIGYLPGLCDVIGDKLYFDYYSGEIREEELYKLEELITLGKQRMKEEK